jgi:hypothetical protein
MHPDVNFMMAQSRIDDMHRAGAANRLAAEARRAAAASSAPEQRAQVRGFARGSLFRRVVTRLAF